MAIAFWSDSDYAQAGTFHQQAVQFALLYPQPALITYAELCLSVDLIATGEAERCLALLNEHSEVILHQKNKYWIAEYYLYTSECYLQDGNLSQAEENLEVARMLAEKLNYWWLLVPIYKNLHTLCSRRSDAEEAETAIEKAMEAAELTGSDKYQEEIYLLASAFFESKNEYSRALEYLKKANGHTEALLLNVPSSTTKKINKSIKKALKKVSEARLQIINAQINENLQESRTLIETLEHKSYSDPLTNIFNRHALEEKLNELALNPSGKIAVIMLDIDHFKSVNDKFGHSKGDEILVKLGEILKSNCRRNREFTARFGGEEFCIIIENEELDSAVQLVRRIQKKIHDYNWHEILPGRDITASFGIAFQRTNDGRFLLNKADEALYKAKEGGRDTFRFCKAPDFQIQSL